MKMFWRNKYYRAAAMLVEMYEANVAKIVYQAEITAAIYDGKIAKQAHDAQREEAQIEPTKTRW